jgi:CRISPR/Cas system CMR-associated protein Cmr5 small subunit
VKIGQRVVEIVFKGVDHTSDSLNRVQKKIGEWSKEFPALAMIAGISLAQIASKIGSLIESIRAAVQENIKLGASFDDMSKRTDLSVETLTKWDYIARMGGATTEEFEAALRKLRQTMADAIGGNEAAIKTFETLGVKVTDANGEMRDLESVLLDIGQSVRQFGASSMQGAAAQDALGRSSAAVVAVIRQR